MKKIFLLILIIALNLGFSETIQQMAKLGDFELESGEIIKDCKIGYRIIGKVNADSSNIILYPTWFGGLSEHITTSLIEKYKVIDPEKYLVIAIDALGNGVSSSPSNYNGEMPIFSIKDMVSAEYKMVKEILGIKHVYGIVGGSMGSFQTFQWLVSYPEFMEKAVPYVCSPKRTSSDSYGSTWKKTLFQFIINMIYPKGNTERIMNILTAYIARTQNYMSRDIPTSEFEEYYSKFESKESEVFTIDNRLSQINAMIQHDITKDFDNSMEKAADQIKAKMLIIVSDSDQIVNPAPAMKLAEITNSQLVILSNECGHLAPGCNLEAFANYINGFLDEK